MPTARSIWIASKLAALGVLLAVAFIGAGEIALRTFWPIPIEPGLEAFIQKSRAFLEPRCESPSSLVRPLVAVVGESSGYFLGQALRDAAQQSGAFGVSNCAAVGSGFEHMRRQFARALEERPDAIVLVFGHNYAFRYPAGAWDFFLLDLRARSHLARAFLARNGPATPYAGPRPPVLALDTFLRDAARVARERSIRLVVTTVTPNLLFPPAGDCPPAEDVLTARLLRAHGRAREARERLAAAPGAASLARVQFELGVWALADGDSAAAQSALWRALELDAQTTRATQDINDVIRHVAGEEGAILHDTAQERASAQPDGITGWETVRDNCHLYADLFAADAAEIQSALAIEPNAAAGARPSLAERAAGARWGIYSNGGDQAPGCGPRPLPGCGAPLASTVGLWRFVARDDGTMAHFIDTWPERAALTRLCAIAHWFAAAGEAYWLAGNRLRARELNARALETAPDLADAWIWRALYDIAEGRDAEAREALGRGVELNSPEAREYLRLLNGLH